MAATLLAPGKPRFHQTPSGQAGTARTGGGVMRSSTRRAAARVSTWVAVFVLGIALVGVTSVVVSGWLIDAVETSNGGVESAAARSGLGDYFGGVSAVFSGTALVLLVITMLFQQNELRMQRQELAWQREELTASRNELRRSAESDLRGLHVQLTQMQLEDPTLSEVWNDYPGQPPHVVRQHLFANLTFGHYLLLFRWGNVTEAEMLVHARDLVRSPAFLRYWAASSPRKAELPAASDESRLFRIFERAISEAAAQTPPGGPGPTRPHQE